MRGVALMVALYLLIGGRGVAEPISDPTKPEPPEKPLSIGTTVSPWTFTATYLSDALANVSGGLSHGASYVDELKLSAAWDGAANGHEGMSALISVEHHNGVRLSGGRVGDYQLVSSLEAPPESTRLGELWVKREILNGRGGFKAGFVDLNTTYDVQDTGALFINSSHGIGVEFGQSGLNGPSTSPTTALALTGFYRPAQDWTVQLGVFDGVAGDPDHLKRFVAVKLSTRDGALLVGQVERRFGDVARAEVGAWLYTADFVALDQIDATGDARRISGDAGVYALMEGRLFSKSDSPESGLSGWVRVGVANSDINPVATYVGLGLVYTGLIKGRDTDEVGVAMARAGFGAPARSAAARSGITLADAETDFEITYRYAFRDWLTLQPDIQYVIHPSANRALGNAIVVGLRLSFTGSK
jgi:porin